jgi:cyclophilin family peptidyl-prolyl cis-trans isomerase
MVAILWYVGAVSESLAIDRHHFFDQGIVFMNGIARLRFVRAGSAVLAIATGMFSAAASAQDAGGASAGNADTAASPIQAKAKFQTELAALKELMKQIEFLRIEFQSADEIRRKELQAALQKQFESAQALLAGLVESALAAYDATGGKDDEVEQFLIAVVEQRVATDRYEEAMPVIESLTQAGAEHPVIPFLGALAAFAVGDYDASASHFKKLVETGLLDQPPQSKNKEELELISLVVSLQGVLEAHKEAWAHEQQIRAAEAESDDLPRVLLKTTQGDITLELFENEAPNTVKNFVTLVEQGAYDNTAFHRVLPQFMAQGGDPTTAGKPEPNYTIPCECYAANARKHFRGSLSMAHRGRDTASAGFFLTFRPTPHLDGQTFNPASTAPAHTVFGRVIEGLEVLAELQRFDPQAQGAEAARPTLDRIVEAKVLRKRPATNYGDVLKLAQ